MTGKLLGRAAHWRSGCHCFDCGRPCRTNSVQRQRERRAWKRTLDT